MDALTTSLLVAAAVFVSSLVGLSLHRVVPDGHLSQETRSVILLGTGTLSLLASLVLGLLVSTAKSSYDATETRIQNYAAELILLDETLRDYGDSALPSRRLLRNYTELFIQILWPKTGAAGTLGESRSAGALMERVRETIRALQPVDEGQKWLQNQALEENVLLLPQRWLLAEGAGPSVRPAYIGILVFWVVLIFASFGFNAPRNATVTIGFLCCSLAIGSAIFLILELDHPFSGILWIPSGPRRDLSGPYVAGGNIRSRAWRSGSPALRHDPPKAVEDRRARPHQRAARRASAADADGAPPLRNRKFARFSAGGNWIRTSRTRVR